MQVLVPNLRGFEKARECGVQEIAVFTAATDSFTLHNTNCTLEESLQNCFKVIKESNATKGMRVRGLDRPPAESSINENFQIYFLRIGLPL